MRVIAQLRYEHPSTPLAQLCDLIDWPSLRQSGETHAAYHDRLYGQAEELP